MRRKERCKTQHGGRFVRKTKGNNRIVTGQERCNEVERVISSGEPIAVGQKKRLTISENELGRLQDTRLKYERLDWYKFDSEEDQG